MTSLKWWQTAVFYQIYPRSFADGNGDGIGDFKGITEKLDYLAGLGVDALWLSPHFPSPNWDCGYDISDYENVASEYGTLDDFKTFLEDSHKRNLRVILDLVLNHTSDEHPWFREALRRKDSKERDYYLFRRGRGEGGSAPPTNWRSMIGPRGWHYHAASDEWYFASFLPFQPDLNHRNPDVQKAVHREQPYEAVATLIQQAREIGFKSINADLIYGLPRQTPATFARTVAQMGALRPDRIALYAYAHLPQRFKPQRRIHAHELPPAGERVHMLRAAISGFQGLGYTHIGMDHFALPDDPLAVAKREGHLHRNFQGYSTQADCDLIGLGVSAIGKIGRCYSQNDKTLPSYYEAIGRSQLAAVRGLELEPEDLLRRDVMMALMCQGRVGFDEIERAHAVHMRKSFAGEIERLRPLEAQGLVAIEPAAIQVTPLGWYFVRAIAMVFDRYLPVDIQREAHFQNYSRVV